MRGAPRFAGRFGKYVLPAIVLQSVLIGGRYATGREIVEYGARFGPRGWIAVVTIFASYLFIALFALPLLTVGAYRILQARRGTHPVDPAVQAASARDAAAAGPGRADAH